MDKISIFTVLVLTALNLMAVSLMLPLIMGRRISRAARFAQGSMLVQAVGWVAIIGSGFWKDQWPDVALSTLSMVLASLANYLMFRALQDWLGPRPGLRLLQVLAVLLPLGYWLSFSNYSLRVGWANFILAAQLLLIARAALCPQFPCSLRWRGLMFVCYGAVAIATVGRGVLGAVFPELYPNFLAPHPINLLAQVTANVALVLTTVAVLVAWREEAEAQLREQAYTDSLTGLTNRQGWDELAQIVVEHAQRHDNSLALILIDLDHFKHINDTHGHDVGDRVLRLMGVVLRGNRRSSDLAARIGGEELALLLPQTDLPAAILFEQRLRQALQHECRLQPQLAVDYSAGLAMLSPTDANLTEFMVRADNALYQAKRLGRGRLEMAG
jgi:diguanylate cyclase (GGDEF)-like protein